MSLPVLLGVGRAAFGAAAYAAPEPLTRYSGMPGAGASADARYMTRLFGARDLVTGVLTLLPRTRGVALPAGALFDVLDTASAVLGGSDGLSKRTSTVGAAVAGAFAAGGVLAIAQSRRH